MFNPLQFKLDVIHGIKSQEIHFRLSVLIRYDTWNQIAEDTFSS